MAEAIVGPLLSKLQEVAVKEAKALAEVGGDINKLRDKLLWLHALAHEADLHSRQDGSRLVQVLAFQIRDAGFDVEDAVDHFFLQGSLVRRFGRYNWWRISKEFVFNFWTHIHVRAILSRRIRSVNVRLEGIIGNNSTYTLSKSGSADSKTWRASRAIPPMRTDWDRDYYSQEFELKCRDDEEKKLMEEIKKSQSQVITVVGVEGVGKTALLKCVYNKKSVKEEFDVRIWLSFGDESMLLEIMKQELDNKTRGEDPNKNFRCLVVIDSPVSSTTWLKVEKHILEMVGEGSKILVSRTLSWHEEKIKLGTKNVVETHGTLELRTMDQDKSKRLFNHIYEPGMRRGTDYKVKEMNNIRDCIYEITNGLPLAVVLVAKLMRTMDLGKWEAAGQYLKCNSEDSRLKTILSVCVDDLSDELKSCLLYTAGFPENRPIDANKLVRLWMAEGFLTQQHKLETEQLGQCYLKELIYRGLLHLEKKGPGGKVMWVAIPHQIHPLLRSEAQRTSFMHVHHGGSIPPPGNTRRLALHSYNDKFPLLDNCLEKLRTVVKYSDDLTDYTYGGKKEKSSKDEPKLVMQQLLQRSPYLRVINLENIQVVKKKKKDWAVWMAASQAVACQASHPGHRQSKSDAYWLVPGRQSRVAVQTNSLPREIGEMVHLQYLGVRCQGLKKVPSSVGNLRNLQTIDVRGTGVRWLPDSLWKVKTLRHVLGDKLAFPRSSTDVGDHLRLMQTLESVTIDHQYGGSCGCTNDAACKRRKLELLRFRSLHRLHVAELKSSQRKDLAYVVQDLESLEALILSGEHIPMDLFAEASEATASWMKHMESLVLDGPLQAYEKLVDDPSCLGRYLVNVTHLVLRWTDIGQDFIDCIGRLQVLAELELLEGSYKDKKLTFRIGEFSSLTILRISGLDTLDEIIVSDATTRRRRNNDINTDNVPDHIKVVKNEHSPSEQQLIAGTAASDQQQEGGEHDQGSSNDQSSHEGQPTEDLHRIITEMILEAAKSNHSSISSISHYIKYTYVVKCLENMVRLQRFTKEKSNNGRFDKYILDRANRWSSQLTEEDGSPLPHNLRIFSKIILEAANKDKSSISSITDYIQSTYVAKCLDDMVEKRMLSIENSKGQYDKYVVLDH